MPGLYVCLLTLDQAGSLMAGQGASQEARKDLHEREMGRREGDDGLQLAWPRFGRRLRGKGFHFSTFDYREHSSAFVAFIPARHKTIVNLYLRFIIIIIIVTISLPRTCKSIKIPFRLSNDLHRRFVISN